MPAELTCFRCSNNTNKLSPQELLVRVIMMSFRSNNTNKLSPQEHTVKQA